MIMIKIENVEEIVEKKEGWFVAKVVGAVVDLEAKVEDVLIEKLHASFAEQGVRATITRT
jgi:hypothetical protein